MNWVSLLVEPETHIELAISHVTLLLKTWRTKYPPMSEHFRKLKRSSKTISDP